MFYRAIIIKLLCMNQEEDALKKECDQIAGAHWEDVVGAVDGSLHIGSVANIPMDDMEFFEKRAHFFILHPNVFELPWELTYPSERVKPPCLTCGGSGELTLET